MPFGIGVQPCGGHVRHMRMELRNRIYRSRSERMVAGVAGGLAEYIEVDPTLVRLAFALAFMLTGPVALMLYVVCALIIPAEPETHIV
jgi:phage shock protein C